MLTGNSRITSASIQQALKTGKASKRTSSSRLTTDDNDDDVFDISRDVNIFKYSIIGYFGNQTAHCVVFSPP